MACLMNQAQKPVQNLLKTFSLGTLSLGANRKGTQESLTRMFTLKKNGIEYVISTDIAKDGMLEGPSFQLYDSILKDTNSNLKLIASGGISTFDELPKLAELGCEGVIIGKAIYENRISLKQLENYILSN